MTTEPEAGDAEDVESLLRALSDRYRPAGAVTRTPRGFRFLARDTHTGGEVFVKVCGDLVAAAREAAALSVLHDCGVARLLDRGVCRGGAFLVLERVHGETLEQVLQQHGGWLGTDAVHRLLSALAERVAALHGSGVLHRDLKPANILVPSLDAPVLIDFEAAALIGEGAEEESRALLTPGYAAPEQYWTDGPEGPWTDVYALGAIGWRALTGAAPPAPALRTPEAARDGDDLSRAGLLPAEVPPALQRALLTALAPDPRARPQDVAAWQAVLGECPSGPGTTDPAERPVVPVVAAVVAADAPAVAVADVTADVPPDALANVTTDAAAATAAAAAAPADELAPTLWVQRRSSSAERAPTAGQAGPAVVSAGDQERAQRGRVGDVGARPGPAGQWRRAAAVAAAISLLLLGGLFGRSLYEQYVKDDWLVDAAGGGDVARIGEALARARNGSTIRIRPGTYQESLQLNRPMTLIAADRDNLPVVAPDAGACLVASATGAAVQGLSFQAAGDPSGSGSEGCVIVDAAGITLEGNRIAGVDAPAVLLRGGADAILERNLLTSSGAGLVVSAGSRGAVRGNTFDDIAGAAIVVRAGAAPDIDDNTIQQSGAVLFTEGAGGSFSNNVLRKGRGNGVEVAQGADPAVDGNRIENPAGTGIYVYDNGRGRFQDNTVTGSGLSGIVIASRAAATFSRNTVSDAGEHGILVLESAGGRLDSNTVRNSRKNGLVLAAGAQAEIDGNTLQGNSAPQLQDLRNR